MRIQRLKQARQSLSSCKKRFNSTQSKHTKPDNRYFPCGFTIPSPNSSPAAFQSAPGEHPAKHSPVSRFLAPGYEVGGRLKRHSKPITDFEEKHRGQWGEVGISLAMVAGPPGFKTFTHRL